MTRINRPAGEPLHPDWYAPEPVPTQPNPQVTVVDPSPDKLLYSPRGEVIARVSDRNPIGFR